MASDGSSPPFDVPHERALGRPFGRAFVPLLDLVIALYALGLLLAVLVGGIDLGIVSLRNPAKPILILALLVPLRLAVAGAPRLALERLIPRSASWRSASRRSISGPGCSTASCVTSPRRSCRERSWRRSCTR
jgi:hypothetical protein